MTNNDTTKSVKPRARRAKATDTARSARVPMFTAATGPSKSDTVIKLLLRTKGATPLELIAATDWQPHSVRAFLSGLRKKGRSIVREPRKNGEAAYRIVVATVAGDGASAAAPSDPVAADPVTSTGTPAFNGAA